MRGLAALLLISTLAGAGAEEWVPRLAADDPALRADARRRLAALGPRALPALERAARSSRPEVRRAARVLLVRSGWIAPAHRPLLPLARLADLRGADAGARQKAFFDLACKGPDGLAALEAVLDGAPPRVRIEAAEPDQTVWTGWGNFLVVLRNVSDLPGWVGKPELSAVPRRRESFGRRVTFPGNLIRGSGGFRRIRHRHASRANYVNTSDEFQWLEPGRETARAYSTGAHLSLLDVGRTELSVSAVFPEREVRLRYVDPRTWIVKIPPRTLLAVSCSERAGPDPVSVYVLPGRKTWGAEVDTTVLTAARERDELVVSLTSDGRSRAPRDFGSTWYAVLDGDFKVVGHGPVADRADCRPRRYESGDLAPIPPAPASLQGRFPFPLDALARGEILLCGARICRGEYREGLLVVSNPVALNR